MQRRHFILSMLSAGLAGPLRSITGQAKPVTIRSGQPLRALPKLVNQSKTPGVFEASLTAVPARLDVGAGQQTEFWAYNGMIPGPLIEATEGDRVRILFENRIPGQVSPIHWHGMPAAHVPLPHPGA